MSDDETERKIALAIERAEKRSKRLDARNEQSETTENKSLAPHCSHRFSVRTDLFNSGLIYVSADRVEYTAAGDAVFWCNELNIPTMALAAGHWSAIVVAGNTLAMVDGLKDNFVADAA